MKQMITIKKFGIVTKKIMTKSNFKYCNPTDMERPCKSKGKEKFWRCGFLMKYFNSA